MTINLDACNMLVCLRWFLSMECVYRYRAQSPYIRMLHLENSNPNLTSYNPKFEYIGTTVTMKKLKYTRPPKKIL